MRSASEQGQDPVISRASGKHCAFDKGLIATTTLGATALVALYTLFFYTPDIRARLPFLIDWIDLPVLLISSAIFAVLGIAGTLLIGVSPLAAWRGIATGTVACLVVFMTGFVGRLIPTADYEGSPLYGFMTAAVLGAGAVLWRARRNRTDPAATGRYD